MRRPVVLHLQHDLDRLWDLHPIIKAHYYHPGFAGSYSIKAVLPAVALHLVYDDLEIPEGTMASLQFHRRIDASVNGDPTPTVPRWDDDVGVPLGRHQG